MAVMAAGLEQQHPVARIGRQAVGQDAAGGTRADHDIVEFAQQFRHRPPRILAGREPLWSAAVGKSTAEWRVERATGHRLG